MTVTKSIFGNFMLFLFAIVSPLTKIHKYILAFIFLFFIILFTSLVYANNLNKYTVVYNNEITTEFIHSRISKFEGFRSYKYKDSVSGIILQGYGKHITFHTPNKISKNIADKWLHDDIAKCEKLLDEHLPWWKDLSNVRKAAMIDLTYNMGINKLKTFKNFLSCMENGEYQKASKHLMKSRYGKQVGIRAKELSTAIKYNKWYCMKS